MAEYLQLDWQTITFVIITILWWAEFRIFPSPGGEERKKSKSFRFILASILISILSTIILTIANVGTIPVNLIEGARIFWAGYLFIWNYTQILVIIFTRGLFYQSS